LADAKKSETPKKKPTRAKTAKPAAKPAPAPAPATENILAAEPDNTPTTGWGTRKLVAVIAGVLLLALVVFGVLIYKFKSDHAIVYAVARIVPYPVERVNNRFISYGNYLFEVKSIKHYYQSQTGADNKPAVDFSTNEGKARLKDLKKQVMEQLKAEAVTKALIDKHRIRVSDKEVKEQIDQITKQAGGEAKVKEVLSKYYGWSYSDFKTKIEYQLARQKLQAKITEDESINQQAKTRAEEVLAKVKAGEDFAELARKYSQDTSASNGGDLGFFGKGQMVAEFEAAAFALEPGKTSELVKTKFGYHIIKVVEKKDDQVKASHILIKAVDFEQYLQDQVKAAKTTTYFRA
jgi:foldase protein PrsA